MKKLEKLFLVKFFNFFLLSFLYSISEISRFKNYKKTIKIPRFEIDKEKMKVKSFIFNSVRPRIEYSYLKNGAYLRPHVDSRAKLLSLMLYFPQNSQKFDTKSQSDLGTQFWLSEKANPKNDHINDMEKFEKIASKHYKSSFERNLLVGFVRINILGIL